MTFAEVLLISGGVLVLLVIYGLIRRAERRGYRLRDRAATCRRVSTRTGSVTGGRLGRPDVPRQDGRDADGTGRPPEKRPPEKRPPEKRSS